MKKALLIGGVVIIVLAGAYLFAERAGSPDAGVPEGMVQTEGTVVSVDLEGAMLDGPILITIADASGVEHVVAVPSMGIRLCAAFEDITDPYTLEAGDIVRVRGNEDESGYIVPCEDASHHVRLIES